MNLNIYVVRHSQEAILTIAVIYYILDFGKFENLLVIILASF